MKNDDMCYLITRMVGKLKEIEMDYNYYVENEKIKIMKIINMW